MSERKSTSPWVWIGVGCGVVILGGIALIAFIVVVVFGAMRSSAPYQDAMQRAQDDPRVAQLLGTPIKPGLFISGEINTKNRSGDADIEIPISGPKGKATIHVMGTKDGGRWTYSRMTVTPEKGGDVIDLLNTPVGG